MSAGQQSWLSAASPVRWLRRAERPPSPSDQLTTRILCANLYLDAQACDAVWNEFLSDPQGGWGTSPGLDLTALLRHARVARRLLLLRDAALLACLLAAPATFVAEAGARHGRHGLVAAGAAMVLLYLVARRAGWLVGRLGARLRARFKRKREQTVRIVLLTAFAAILAGIWLASLDIVVRSLVVLAGGVVVAWTVCVAAQFAAIRHATRCRRAAESPAQTASRLSAAVEARLEGVAKMNVIAYRETRASTPFIGSGLRIEHWPTSVDIRHAADPDGDGPEPFEVGDLLLFLERDWQADNPEGIRHGLRLYVHGGKLEADRDLLPSPSSPPVDRLAPETIAYRNEQRDNEDFQRVFFLESLTRRDDLVVTASARAGRRGHLLFFEVTLNALLPLLPAIVDRVRRLPAHRRDLLYRVLREGTRHLPRHFLSAPNRLAGRLVDARVFWRGRRLAALVAKRFRYHDYGASITAREGLSSDNFKAPDDNVRRALERDTVYMVTRLARGLRAFLVERGISTSSLDGPQSVTTIIQNWKVDTVKADIVGFGNANTFIAKAPGA
ncbi:hypothetical protein [Dactylosporangium sp. NPDC048998]|uniref:hypothetical protein n=1 Tax=Dactylosporangium sp. NPDC048998 TaxID=3363976 RepID=UPI00372398E3